MSHKWQQDGAHFRMELILFQTLHFALLTTPVISRTMNLMHPTHLLPLVFTNSYKAKCSSINTSLLVLMHKEQIGVTVLPDTGFCVPFVSATHFLS